MTGVDRYMPGFMAALSAIWATVMWSLDFRAVAALAAVGALVAAGVQLEYEVKKGHLTGLT